MHFRHLFAVVLLLTMSVPLASADDGAKYPNWKGQWNLVVVPGLEGQAVKFDPTKPWGLGQEAPLTDEYKKVHEQSMTDQAEGGLGNYPSATCHPGGMPRLMAVPGEYEFVIQPETTYILIGTDDPSYRRIFTDGRLWPADLEPSYAGYSIGHWIDEGGTGTFNVLEVETRGPFKGPRAFDATGLPLAFDNESIFKERFYLDKTDSNIMHDMITVTDHALTRPWTADKTYHRNGRVYPNWREGHCIEGNVHIVIGKENYYLSADGLLMPAKKNQAPPDLRYFKQSQK
jgi:hypothetical protein